MARIYKNAVKNKQFHMYLFAHNINKMCADVIAD